MEPNDEPNANEPSTSPEGNGAKPEPMRPDAILHRIDCWLECSPHLLTNRDQVWLRFMQAVNATPRVTIIGTHFVPLPDGGLAGTVFLGQGHAAIHTWCRGNVAFAWCELVTVGDARSCAMFVKTIISRFGAVVMQTVRFDSCTPQGPLMERAQFGEGDAGRSA